MCVRVWEYQVPEEHVERFLAAYGSDGAWTRLSSGSSGYSGTDLYPSASGADRLLTVDRWDVEGSWRAFLDRHREAYRAPDARTERLTAAEHLVVEGTS